VFLTAAAARAGSLPEQVLSGILRLPILRYLGRISYSIYLAHMIPLYVCMYLIGARWSHGAAAYFAVLFVATVAATIAISHVLYTYVEKPSIELGRRFAGQVASAGIQAQ
jgi:peptidoglycan/LPS O-acetylase OafA/YrhL